MAAQFQPGTFENPLPSANDGCPVCGDPLRPVEPTFLEQILQAMHEQTDGLVGVECDSCGWAGAARTEP